MVLPVLESDEDVTGESEDRERRREGSSEERRDHGWKTVNC